MSRDAPYRSSDGSAIAELHPKGVRIRRDTELPRSCIACGTTKQLRRKEQLGSDDIHPVVVGNPVSVLAGMLLVFFVRLGRARRRFAPLAHWQCPKCEAALRTSSSMNLGLLFAPFVALLFGITAAFAASPLWGALVGIVTLTIVVLVVRATSGGGPTVEIVDADGVVLSGLEDASIKKLLAARARAGTLDEQDGLRTAHPPR